MDRRSFVSVGAAAVAGAYLQNNLGVVFARDTQGTPGASVEALPNWTAFNTTERAAMVFNDESKLVRDPSGEELRTLYTTQASS